MVASFLQGEFAVVLFEILVIVIQLFVASVYAGSLRKKVFTKEFFEKNFPELKGDFPRGGYPDMGTGKYSQKLPLDQWQAFNQRQRAHLNFVEGAPIAICALLICGLFQPRLAALCGAAYIAGRTLYILGYAQKPAARLPGFLLFNIGAVTALISALISTFSAAGGVKGLATLLANVLSLNILV